MKQSLFLKQFLLAFLILSFSSAAFALDFDFNIVESGDYLGYAKDAVCGPDGRIHLSYMNGSGGRENDVDDDLNYAVYDGSNWTTESILVPGDSLSSNTSIALDNSGYPHILYNYTCNAVEHFQDLDHAWWDGSQWQTENIVDGVSLNYKPGHPSLAISDSNVMNVVFHVEENMYWATRQLPSGSWISMDIEGVTGSHTSMALDNSGYPHVSYRIACSDTLGLGYSYYDGASWIHQEVVSGDVKGTCIVLDPDGIPCISFVDDTDSDILYFAHKNGSDWEVESVDQAGNIMWEFTSLGFASDGTPFIAYLDEEFEPGILKVAQRNSGGEWTVTEVDEAGDSGSCQLTNVCLVVDDDNNVHTFYNGYNDIDSVNADINHAVADSGIVGNDDVTNVSSGGGCNTGAFVPSMLLLLAPLFILARKR